VPPRVLDVRELDSIAVAGVQLHRVRHALGLTAFGANAYTADAGELLIEDHDELESTGAGYHEELYVVLHGRATFTVDGEELDAPAGSLVFVQPPERRSAVAAEDGTVALVVGGPAGAAGPVSAWEYAFSAVGENDPDRAYAVAAEGLADHPDNASLHYNLACFAVQASRREQALEHLRIAFEQDPKTREWAARDSDLDPIRDALP
jgi:mannose-6-phosphate isomerase-like protein (cupin superfamily)